MQEIVFKNPFLNKKNTNINLSINYNLYNGYVIEKL